MRRRRSSARMRCRRQATVYGPYISLDAGSLMSESVVPEVPPGTLEVVPLGGVGEFGMNMMAVSWGDTTVLIDAGVMFPDPDQLGVDLIIPDLTFVEARAANVKALILTHAHEDHIGAVPHVVPLFNGPIYGTAFTLALVAPKLEE